jgi:hypothetical protein
MRAAISLHLVMPVAMHWTITASSSLVHGPLTRPGRSTL